MTGEELPVLAATPTLEPARTVFVRSDGFALLAERDGPRGAWVAGDSVELSR